MDRCVEALTAFSPDATARLPCNSKAYETGLRTHVARINKLAKEQAPALQLHASRLLEILDPATHSLSYLTVLDHLPSIDPQTTDSKTVDQITHFFLVFDDRQIRYCGTAFSTLFDIVASGKLMPASVATHVLTQALLRIDRTGSMLTSNHLSLIELAYQTNKIASTVPLITKQIVYYPGMANQKDASDLSDPTLPPPSYISKTTGLTTNLRPARVLEYDFCVGLMFCTIREWSLARAAFARVASYPTRENSCSKIMKHAHKRWVLVSLLDCGKTSPYPPLTATAAQKTFNIVNKAYLEIAEIFAKRDAALLRREVTNSEPTYAADETDSLVHEVVAAHQKWQIASLRDVYFNISLSEIRKITKSAETGKSLQTDQQIETMVEEMISSAMINATIIRPDGGGPAYLQFLFDVEVSEAEYAARLATTARKINDLAPALKATQERLGTHKEYIRHIAREQKREKEIKSDAGYDDAVDEEDLMTGLITGNNM